MFYIKIPLNSLLDQTSLRILATLEANPPLICYLIGHDITLILFLYINNQPSRVNMWHKPCSTHGVKKEVNWLLLHPTLIMIKLEEVHVNLFGNIPCSHLSSASYGIWYSRPFHKRRGITMSTLVLNWTDSLGARELAVKHELAN